VTDTNVFQLSQPGTFADPLTEFAIERCQLFAQVSQHLHYDRIDPAKEMARRRTVGADRPSANSPWQASAAECFKRRNRCSPKITSTFSTVSVKLRKTHCEQMFSGCPAKPDLRSVVPYDSEAEDRAVEELSPALPGHGGLAPAAERRAAADTDTLATVPRALAAASSRHFGATGLPRPSTCSSASGGNQCGHNV
jgi:hypothetical protein